MEANMKEEDLEYFKGILINHLNELLKQGEGTVLNMKELDTFLPDPLDQATFDMAQGMTLRIRDRERKLVEKIMNALENIEEGNFGICDTCGEDISINRLKARPVTTLCISCKTKQERLEKYFA